VTDHNTALLEAVAVAEQHGLDSPVFRTAEERAGQLYRKIRELLGATGENWMASDG
jgi:hypothetical protein